MEDKFSCSSVWKYSLTGFWQGIREIHNTHILLFPVKNQQGDARGSKQGNLKCSRCVHWRSSLGLGVLSSPMTMAKQALNLIIETQKGSPKMLKRCVVC